MDSDDTLNIMNETSSGVESEAEVSLISSAAKPASTDELKDMLKDAGTELTVKYITGEITFEDFCKELEKKRPKPKKTSDASAGSEGHSAASIYMKRPKIPQFDELMEDEIEDNEPMDNDAWEEEEDEELDAGELVDQRDEDWQPDSTDQKELSKADGKGKKSKTDPPMRTKKRRPRRKPYDIPRHLASQHGQAMLLRAQGKVEESMMLLFDIIEKAPLASAPFKTLGSIHEEKGDLEQALKFYMVSANLRKGDIGEWFDLNSMWNELKNEKMALMCFTKAFKYARTDSDKLEVLSRRILFYQNFGYPEKIILQTKDQMIPYMRQSDPEQVLEFARNVTKELIDIQEMNAAIACMFNYFEKLPNTIDSEDVHQLVEVLMSQKNYTKSIEMVIKLCGVECETTSESITAANSEQFFSDSANSLQDLTKLTVPSVMPIDLKSKFIQCLLLAKAIRSMDVLEDLLKEIASVDVEEYGDIDYEIAETLVECGFVEKARPLLQALVKSESFNQAAVWLTYGQCLNSLGDIAEAARAYETVLELAPGHYGARVTLSSLQQQMGHHDRALELLSKDPTKEEGASTDQLLLLRKCQLLHSQEKMDDFVKAAVQLLSFNLRGQLRPDFIRAILNSRTIKYRLKMFPEFINPKDPKAESQPPEPISDLQRSEQLKFKKQVWDIYLKLSAEMYQQKRLAELVKASILAISCPTFCFGPDDSRSLDAEFLCLKICAISKAESFLSNITKAVISKAPDNNQIWNLYCYVGTICRNVVDIRYAMRGLMKAPNSTALRMLNGTARLVSGSYKQALGEYLSVFRIQPECDLAILCCGICLVHIASQIFCEKKNVLLAQVMCLLQAYKGGRGECQEAYYNMGRAMQQLNLKFIAIHSYKKALEFPPIVQDDQNRFDLTYEIAFNLANIYEQSGNEDYARYYIEKYCVI